MIKLINIFVVMSSKMENLRGIGNPLDYTGFSEEIFTSSYRFGEKENVGKMVGRVADFVSSAEDDPIERDFWNAEYCRYIGSLRFIPAGRVLSNAGTGLKATSLVNCYVDGFVGTNQDSLAGISEALRRQAAILKTEGGYGFCSDVLRPRGAYISGIGNDSCGSVEMLHLWDSQSAVFTSGNIKKAGEKIRGKMKVRNGAQMVTKSVWHPDILEFIDSKQMEGVLTRMNLSVLFSDAFMNAVENDGAWSLVFPDYEADIEKYDNEWDGDLDKWLDSGGRIKIYQTLPARDIWERFIQASYNRNEPSALFIDTINRKNNLRYIERINSTNPCGEQPLPKHGACNLGSINIAAHVNNGEIDFNELKSTVRVAVRFLDSVIDVTNLPHPENREEMSSKRRIGLGILGLGSAFMMLGLEYGSSDSVELTHRIMRTIVETAYKASADLAIEKGSFPLFDADKYLSSQYLNALAIDPDTIRQIRSTGIRNSHLISMQPTGTTAIWAGQVSGGIEPVFMPEYWRTSRVAVIPDGMIVPQISWGKVAKEIDGWNLDYEGDEPVYKMWYGSHTYKIDKTRGLTRVTRVSDYAVRYRREYGTWDAEAPYAKGAMDLSYQAHMNILYAVAPYVDSAISKTINLRNDFPLESFRDMYMDAWRSGTLKGVTAYREGTMQSVLSADDGSGDAVAPFKESDAPERPESLPARLHIIKSTPRSGLWAVIVGLMDDKPYEIFSVALDKLNIPAPVSDGTIVDGSVVKVASGSYKFISGLLIIPDISVLYATAHHELVTRLASTALRHGSKVQYVAEQIMKAGYASEHTSIGMVLKQYIPDMSKPRHAECPNCGGEIRYVSGCIECPNCGWSKC